VGIPSWMGFFFATTCCCLRPLSSWWNSGYREAFLKNFFLFHDEILAITKPFSRIFFFFHDGILAITNFSSFFTMEFWLSRSLSHELFFFFHDGILAITKHFSRTFLLFSRWNSENTRFGGRLFLYIYHKEYLHRIRLIKNLAS
jgi:hypothetical protein